MMKKVLCSIVAFFLILGVTNAETYTIPEYSTSIDDEEETIDKLTNSTASIGNIGVTLSFGGFIAYNFIWSEKGRKDGNVTYRRATDLCSGKNYMLMICKGEEPYDFVLQFVTDTNRRYTFPLLRLNNE